MAELEHFSQGGAADADVTALEERMDDAEASLISVESAQVRHPSIQLPDLRLTPVAVSGGFIFKPHLGVREMLDTIDTTGARASTDFSLKADANPTGAEAVFNAIKYATVEPTAGGWKGSTTLAHTGVNIAVDTSVTRLDRATWEKRIVLTADAATTILLRQAHGERSGEGGGLAVTPIGAPSASAQNNTYMAVQAIGLVKNAAYGHQAMAVGMAIQDGFTGQYGPDQTNVLERSSPGFQIIAVNLGIKSTGAKQLPLAANVPTTITITYFACPLRDRRDFQLAAHRARGLSLGYRDDLFKQTMLATARARLYRTSDSDAGVFMIPEGHYGGFTFTRDSFWTSIGMDDPEPGRLVLQRLAALILSNKVPTAYQNTGIASGYNGVDSNANFLMWMWWLTSRYGILEGADLPTGTQRNNAITGITAALSSGEYVVDLATSIGAGWLDNYRPPGGVTQFATACVTGLQWAGLKAGQHYSGTGFLPNATLDDVKAAYRAYWNGSYMNFCHTPAGGAMTDTGAVDITALMGEFFANLLFDTPLLTDQMVYGHIDKIFATNVKTLAGGRCFKNIVSADGTYFPTGRWANVDERANQGNYDNGGSWLLHDFIVCAVGKYHGYTNQNLDAFWNERRRTELAVNCASHEYLNLENTTVVDPLGTCVDNSLGNGWNTLTATCEDIFGLGYEPVRG